VATRPVGGRVILLHHHSVHAGRFGLRAAGSRVWRGAGAGVVLRSCGVRDLYPFRVVIINQLARGMTPAEIAEDFTRRGLILSAAQVELALRAWGTSEAA
jgi:hypothetical protein